MKIQLKEISELIVLDSLVFVLCLVQLSDWLIFAQIATAISATIYTWIRIFDWIKKRKK